MRDESDAEDLVQEVFYELIEANRLLTPIDFVTGWLFRVARNRITDFFRKKKPENFTDTAVMDENGELMQSGRFITLARRRARRSLPSPLAFG